MNSSTLTVLFEAPFWIGLYERLEEGGYSVCKITFGSEPKDYEVYNFILKNWSSLKFSPFVKSDAPIERRVSPKRMQREISAQLKAGGGTGTKAQQALKLQHEQAVKERKALCRERADAEKERQFALKQEKKKARHRGK